ncbi:MAG: hypothetical protein AAGD07_16710 [Planctomycetota bacterium]
MNQRRWVGMAFWAVTALLAAGSGFLSVSPPGSVDGSSVNLRLGDFETRVGDVGFAATFTGRDGTALSDTVGWNQVGDSVFATRSNGEWVQVGHISSIASPDANTVSLQQERVLQIRWHVNPAIAEHVEFVSYRSTGRMEEVVAMLLPAEKRERLRERIAEAVDRHGDAIARSMLPLVGESIRESLPVIEAALVESLARHQKTVDALVGKYQLEIVQQKLAPIAKEEILPIIRRHGEAPATEIGQEVWSRAPLWQFTWRALYDQSPLPKKELVKEEFRRFVDDEVVPVIEEHMDDIVVAIQKTLADMAANQEIRRALMEAAEEITSDPEARQLARTVISEAILENDRLLAIWQRIWRSDRARLAMRQAGDRLEPVLRGIADEIIGTRADGISPGFARALRNQILGKDRSWIVARPSREPKSSSDKRELMRAPEPMIYPVIYLANPDKDATEAIAD